jgi:hypothetical protein
VPVSGYSKPPREATINAMTAITKLIVDAHIDDLRRDAERAALRAQRRSSAVTDFPITIRRATKSDEPALAQLAALDSAPLPASPVLLGESNGQLRAALSLNDGATVADPFHATAAIVELLVTFAAQGQDGRGKVSRLRRRRRIRKLAVRRGHDQASAVLT